MDSSLLTDDRALIDWFNRGHDSAVRDTSAMLALPPESWPRWIDENRQALTYHFASALLKRSVEARDREPAVAVALTRFLVDQLPRLEVPVPEADRNIRAAIWIERGNALLVENNYPAALDAFEQALAIPANPALPLHAAVARRGAAYARFLKGDETDEPLRTIRADVPLFEAHCSTGDVLRSHFLEAAILYGRGQFREAKATFEETLRLARHQRDERMLARVINNLGHCERQLGRHAEAVHHLVEAMHLFEKHGMTAERFRPQWGIELLRADEGAATEAVAALRDLMQPLIESGRTIEAALVALDVVEVLVLSERQEHVRRVASDLVTLFDEAQMPREAMRAFAALRAAAAERTLTAQDVRAAAADVRAVAD